MTHEELAAEIRKNLIHLVVVPDDLNAWIESQRPEMPTNIAALAGYNYAVSQIANKIEALDPKEAS